MPDAKQEATSRDGGRMSLISHLEELRRRIFYALAMVLVATIVCFSLAPQLFEYLRHPLVEISGQQMIVLGPLEMFVTYLKIAVLAGVFISIPWLLAQLWLFIAPGLYKNEKRWILPFVFLGSIFFVGGGAFAFFVVMPLGFEYLVKMVPEAVQPQYSVAIYFSLVVRLLLAFGVAFELPLIMWILALAGIVEPKTFAKFRKYWIVIAAVIAAFLTPPDPFTQLMMAIPLVAFFELGILGARLLHRKRSAVTTQ